MLSVVSIQVLCTVVEGVTNAFAKELFLLPFQSS